jgi:hypothetical protein
LAHETEVVGVRAIGGTFAVVAEEVVSRDIIQVLDAVV